MKNVLTVELLRRRDQKSEKDNSASDRIVIDLRHVGVLRRSGGIDSNVAILRSSIRFKRLNIIIYQFVRYVTQTVTVTSLLFYILNEIPVPSLAGDVLTNYNDVYCVLGPERAVADHLRTLGDARDPVHGYMRCRVRSFHHVRQLIIIFKPFCIMNA